MKTKALAVGWIAGMAFVANAIPARSLTDDSATLKYIPKVGDVVKYRVKIAVDIPGGSAEITMLDSRKVLSVDANGDYTEQSIDSEGKVLFQAKENPIPVDTTKTTYHADGSVAKIVGTDVTADSYRTENLQQFFPPTAAVKVGDAWSVPIKGDPKIGSVNLKADYKVDSAETVGTHSTFKVKFTEKEDGATPGSMDGYIWIDMKDGTVVKVDAKMVNMPVPNSAGPVSGTVTLVREG